MTEPTTAAGRALYQHLREVHEAGYIGGTTWERVDRAILAIEAEARQQDSAHSEFPTATPRPWTVDTLEGGGWAVVVDADGAGAKVIAELDDTYGDRAANAALIVEAVNAAPSASPGLDVPNMGILTAILEDAPTRVIGAAVGDSAEALAATIIGMWPEYARLQEQDR